MDEAQNEILLAAPPARGGAMNAPGVVDALGMACLIIMGGCALAVLFHVVERILEGRGIFDRPKLRRPR
jgi:hypothetical protein